MGTKEWLIGSHTTRHSVINAYYRLHELKLFVRARNACVYEKRAVHVINTSVFVTLALTGTTQGLYFADCVTKSANYCFATRQRPEGILLLCEVALGKSDKRLDADSDLPFGLKKGCKSVMGLGQQAPDPSKTIKRNGYSIPLGNVVSTGIQNCLPNGRHAYTLAYNEYITYNTELVRPKFLLRVKFDYGGSAR